MRTRIFCRHVVTVASAVLAVVGLSISAKNAAAYTYQIDSGTAGLICCDGNGNLVTLNFNNSLGVAGENASLQEDNWVGNTFTVKAYQTSLTSITWLAGINQANIPSGNVTAALYSGTPSTGLTLLTTASEPTSALANNTWETLKFSSPVLVTAGEQFTAALLINGVPSNAFPWTADNSGISTNGTHGSYYDISNPIGAFGTYNIASPNFPVLNGTNYFAGGPGGTDTGSSNFGPTQGITMLRVNATPEPSSIALALVGLAAMSGYGVRRRRKA